jgi:hypothetical protein
MDYVPIYHTRLNKNSKNLKNKKKSGSDRLATYGLERFD